MSEEFTYDHAFETEVPINRVDDSKTRTNIKCDKKTKSSSCYYFMNRLAFCLLAQVALWLTCLRNSTIIASDYIEVPTFTSVYQSCDSAHQEVILEKVKYDTCVDRQLKRCNLEFEIALTTENKRVAVSQTNNKRMSINLQNQISNCTDAISSTSSIVQSWTSGNHARSISYYTTCSAESRIQLQSVLGEDRSASNEVTVSASTFVEQYDLRIVTLATYSKDLSEYNAEYIANKTEFLHLQALGQIDITMLDNIPSITSDLDPIYDLTTDIIACMSLNATMAEKCTYANSVYNSYIVAQRKMNNQISEIIDAVNAYEQVVTNYVDEVEMAIDKVNLFYQSVFGNKGVISWLLNTVKIIYTLGDMCGNSDPNMCSFSPEDWAISTPNWPSISVDLKAPDASEIVNEMSGYVGTISTRIADISTTISSDLVALQENIHVSIDDIDWVPKDYNPPRYPYKNDTNEEVIDQREESQQYLANLRKILFNSNFSTSSASKTSISTSIVNNPSALINGTWVQSQSRSIWSWVREKSHPWSVGNVEFVWILQSFLTLQGILFLFDYLYRAVQSLRLFVRFWSRSLFRLPSLDAIEEEEHALFNTMSSTVKCCHLFFRLLPLLWVQALILLAMLVATIFIVSALIIPEYNSYCRACVHHSTNETFLTELTQTGLYNLAAGSGNTRWVTGIAKYNSYSAAACDKGIATTQQPYTQSLQTLQSLNQTYAYYVSQADMVKTCVDMNTMDTAIRQYCCPQSAATNDDSCNTRNTTLTSSCPSYLQSVSSQEMFLQSLWSSTSYPSLCSPSYLLYETNAASDSNEVSASTLVWRNALKDVTSSAMFDCSVLPACVLTCDGPNELLLARRSKDCMCRIEWFWNAHLLQGVLVVVIFIVLNVSRDLICSGLLRVWWCHFLPPTMTVTISVPLPGYEQGDLNSDEDCQPLIMGEKIEGTSEQKLLRRKSMRLSSSRSHKTSTETTNKNASGKSHAVQSLPTTTVENDRDIEAAYSLHEEIMINESNHEEENGTSESSFSDEENDYIGKRSSGKYLNNSSLKSISLSKKYSTNKASQKNGKMTPKISRKSFPSKSSRKTVKTMGTSAKGRLIQQQMRWKLFWFVFMGYVKIVTGIAINYLWIALAQAIERNISYDGDPYPSAASKQ